jgi:hypothetical protein
LPLQNVTNFAGCNNPSPLMAPNGTLFLFCTWSIRKSESGDPRGPWTHPIAVSPPSAANRRWEDPFLFIDARGNFHLLSHTYSMLPYPSNSISGHAYSRNGLDWTFSPHEPYSNVVRRADGSVQHFATMERPKLLFMDPARPFAPTHLINGVSPVWLDGPDPCAPCGHCSACKCHRGMDWTYTLMTSLGAPHEL